MGKISIHKIYQGKTILLAGGTGFLGKVWLAMLLDRVPEIRKVYVLLRRKGSRSATARFELMVNTIQAFQPLHEKHGHNLSAFLAERIEVLEGDVSLPHLGLSDEVRERVQNEVDLVVNSAGLVDFNPDLRLSVSANVDGPLHVLEFVRGCAHASLQHVSTCYVSGVRKGRVPETVVTDVSPRGLPFDGELELKDVTAMMKQIEAEHESPDMNARVQAEMNSRKAKANKENGNGSGLSKREQMIRKRLLKDAMIAEGRRRVAKWGYNDIYTYTKGLAEALLVRRAGDVRYSIFRPAIIESAMEFPFPGWNEGFNTSGPLTYLSGTWFRYLPTRVEHPLDIIPVDMVCRSMIAVGAALLAGEFEPVYHCGTSDKKPMLMGRVCELTQLSHRTYLRKYGTNMLERVVLSRWDVIPSPVSHPLAVRRLRHVVNWAAKRLEGFSTSSKWGFLRWLGSMGGKLNRIVRRIDQVEDVLELFYPYIRNVHRNFETNALGRIDLEETEYAFNPEDLHWRAYWLEVHMPGLRRWCYPVIEGRKRELYEPAFPVSLNGKPEPSASPMPGDLTPPSSPEPKEVSLA